MENLGKLPLEAVLPVAERLGTGSRDEWADELGTTPSVIYRSFNGSKETKNYFVSFGRVPSLCVAMQSDFLLRWAYARYAYLKAQQGLDLHEPISVQESFRELARLTKEFGDYADTLEKAGEDGEFDERELRNLKRELCDVIQVAADSLQGIEALIEEKESRIRD
jgi:hypothetical protein